MVRVQPLINIMKTIMAKGFITGRFHFKGLDGTIKIKGTYKNGKRNGGWVCTLTNYYYIVMTMTGTIQTKLFQWNREGVWTYTISGEVSKFDVSGKETSRGKITFKNNVVVGEFLSTDVIKVKTNAGKHETTTTIEGTFDENGYKTGVWNIQSVVDNLPIEEIKKYKKGYC